MNQTGRLTYQLSRSEMDYCIQVGRSRFRAGRSLPFQDDTTGEYHIAGATAEFVARAHFGLPLSLSRAGDPGFDLRLGSITVDCKATGWNPRRYRNLQIRADKTTWADVFLLGRVAGNRVMLAGWTSKDLIRSAPIRYDLPIPAHQIPIKDLYILDLLLIPAGG